MVRGRIDVPLPIVFFDTKPQLQFYSNLQTLTFKMYDRFFLILRNIIILKFCF